MRQKNISGRLDGKKIMAIVELAKTPKNIEAFFGICFLFVFVKWFNFMLIKISTSDFISIKMNGMGMIQLILSWCKQLHNEDENAGQTSVIFKFTKGKWSLPLFKGHVLQLM